MIVAILAAYKLLNLKKSQHAIYAMYLEQNERLDAQLRDRAKDNVPTERQRAGFVSYLELQKVRNQLAFGSKDRLLLSFYGGCIPPLRNDLHACAIQLLKCDDDEAAQQALLHQVTPNEILLPVDRNSPGVLILTEFKTQDRKHPVLYTRSLGSEFTKELRASLEKEPRTFFVHRKQHSKAIHAQRIRHVRKTHLAEAFRKAVHADFAETQLHQSHARLRSADNQRSRAVGRRDVSFACDTSTVSMD